MLGKLKSMLGMKGDALPKNMTYDETKKLLEVGTVNQKVELAGREDITPEALYYLSQDASPKVRRLIAANPLTPVHADENLVSDEDNEVRQELARKIGRIVPNLKISENKALSDKAVVVLEELARDQLPKVRAIIADAIKSSETVPKRVIKMLARDVEDIVCGPILEYSPLLNDDDLREIIAAGASSFALTRIANRVEVSENVSHDIATTLDIPAVAALLTNQNALIREDTLDQIIDQATNVDDLHKPLALRPQLSIRAMKRITGFVASALVHAMMEKANLPEDQAEEILEEVRSRLATEDDGSAADLKLEEKAKDFFKRGMLGDEFIVELIGEGHREILIYCLALMANLSIDVVRKIVMSKSGRAVTALAWKADLTMRTAYAMQTKFALVPNAQLLSAKNGKDYPIDENELDWHLSYFIDQDEEKSD